MTNQNNELDKPTPRLKLAKILQDYKDGVVDYIRTSQAIEALYAPKLVENGELLTINNLITKWAQIVGVKDGFSYVVKILIDPADGFADDAFSSNLRNELEAYLAQEKAKLLAEVEQVIGEDETSDIQLGYVARARNALRAEQRQALAKLLDKENAK